jgi:hypothetical protein
MMSIIPTMDHSLTVSTPIAETAAIMRLYTLHHSHAGVLVSMEDILIVAGAFPMVILIVMVITIRFITPITHLITTMGITDHITIIHTGMDIMTVTIVAIMVDIIHTITLTIMVDHLHEMCIMEPEVLDHPIPIVPMVADQPIPDQEL